MEKICLLGMDAGILTIRFTACHFFLKKCLKVISCILKTTCMFGQKFVNACKIERWAVVNFSARCDVRNLVRDLTRVAESKGIVCYPYPFDLAALCMKMTGLMHFV